MKDDYPYLDIPESLRRRMVELAREFRKEPTKSERLLWQALRAKKLDGIKFRRQQPVGPMVLDFYNSDYRLVVEVDGPIHDSQKEADRERQEILEMLGFNMLRIKAELVEKDLPVALELIRIRIQELQSRPNNAPSPFMGEGRGGGEGLGVRGRGGGEKGGG